MATDSMRRAEMEEARALRQQREAAKKRRALAMIADDVPLDEIGRQLHVCEKTLAKWKREANHEQSNGNSTSASGC